MLKQVPTMYEVLFKEKMKALPISKKYSCFLDK